MRGSCRNLGSQLSSRTSKFRTWLVFVHNFTSHVLNTLPGWLLWCQVSHPFGGTCADTLSGMSLHFASHEYCGSLLTVCFFCWPFNDLLSVLQLRAWTVSWSHLQVPFLWTFLASLHWKSGLYLISSGWWSHVLSSSYLFPAKSSWLGPRLLKDHVVVLDVSLWVSGANRNLWSFWEYLPNPEELQKAVKVDSASQRAISILEFLSLYKSGSSLL